MLTETNAHRVEEFNELRKEKQPTRSHHLSEGMGRMFDTDMG